MIEQPKTNEVWIDKNGKRATVKFADESSVVVEYDEGQVRHMTRPYDFHQDFRPVTAPEKIISAAEDITQWALGIASLNEWQSRCMSKDEGVEISIKGNRRAIVKAAELILEEVKREG